MVFVLVVEFIYYLLIIFTHEFSNMITIIFLLATLVRIKYWNLFVIAIPSLVSILIYNNSASLVSLVYNSNLNVTSPIDL